MNDTRVTHPDHGARWAASIQDALDQPPEQCPHRPLVSPFAGIPPRCSCGWEPGPGELLADHLRATTTRERT